MITRVIKAFLLTVAVTVGTVMVLGALTVATMVGIFAILAAQHWGP